ncbi:hypothetical protein [Cytobacillus firmus]|uniref:hypothetical protein n=1 Tax=Cytobacillus firmus TaxID=1399 RepID=UPI0018CDEE37|nr:hypothetical protein [Cytobacillus firmus]MBG9444025.1 hypothetical protein [Cytobacillus firmus]
MAKLSFEQLVYMALITGAITVVFNLVFQLLKDRFEWFSNEKKFRRDFAFEQVKELYIPSYAIIAQSEFLRRFEGLDDKPFDEFPFLEIDSTKTKYTYDFQKGIFEKETVNFSDVITDFNKGKLSTMIIDKGIFASQELLKLAVAYRFVYKYYTDESIDPLRLEKFQIQEVDLINKIVRLIVRETNEKLMQCKLSYNKDEIDLSTMLVDYVKMEKEADGSEAP